MEGARRRPHQRHGRQHRQASRGPDGHGSESKREEKQLQVETGIFWPICIALHIKTGLIDVAFD